MTDDADADASRAAARIKAHMNRSHQRDMSLYLRRFAHLPSTHEDVFSLAQLELTSIDTSGMTVRAASGTTYPIPFDPPLASLGETRQRLVAMDADCRKALRLPPAASHKSIGGSSRSSSSHSRDVTVTEYAPPQGLARAIMFAVVVYISCVALLPWMRQGTALARFLDAVWWFGGGVAGFRWLVEAIRLPVAAVHLVETAWFHVSRMGRYGVRTWSVLWWKWMVSVAIEGATAFKRIDGLAASVARKQA